MSKAYTYRLGLDMGISSVGSGVLQLNQGKPVGVLDAGVRIFPISDGAAERTEKRRARRNSKRTKKRLKLLTQILQDNGLYPESKSEIDALNRLSVYAIRRHAARYKLNDLTELGRAILHIAKHRGAGFVTEMEEASEGASVGMRTKSSAYDLMRENVEDYRKGATLGEYLCSRLRCAESLPVRQRKRFREEKLVEYAIPRYLVRHEFRKIWEVQAKYYPALTQELFESVGDVLFFERPHAPYAVGRCIYVSTERRLPRMHPLSVECRIYEEVNNIRIEKDAEVIVPDKEQRDLLVRALMRGEDMKKKAIKELLGVPGSYSVRLSGSFIAGWPFESAFENSAAWQSMDWDERTALIEFIAEPTIEEDEDGRLMPEAELVSVLCRKLGVDEREVPRVLSCLPKGHSSLGETATVRILERLKDGRMDMNGKWRPVSQREAADLCGFEAEEEKARRLQDTFDMLPYYGRVLTTDTSPVHPWHKDRACPEEAEFGRIANPAVHVALNQLRHVVNDIVRLYGKPQSIHVELTREFGKSKQKRDELKVQNEARRQENDDVADELRNLGARVNRRNILKYKLWKEQVGRDPFTLNTIGESEIFKMEIEHLIPRGRGGSDSPVNLVLVDRNPNAAKDNLYPYEYLSGSDKWPQILRNAKQVFSHNKVWRFFSDARERFEGEGDLDGTDRLLQDTSYIAKMAARYLRVICGDVVTIKGGYTGKMRHVWGLDGLEYELLGLDVPREINNDETGEVVRNRDWKSKPRIDQRHHAIDAVVVACIDRKIIQGLGRAYNSDLTYDYSKVPLPWGGNNSAFRCAVMDAMSRVRISFKPDRSPGGELHEATARWVLGKSDKEGFYYTRYNRSYSNLTTIGQVEKLPFKSTIPLATPELEAEHAQLCRIRDRILGNLDEAEVQLLEMNRQREEDELRPFKVTERLRVMWAIRIARNELGLPCTYPVYTRQQLAFVRPEGHGYTGGRNHRMDFFVKPNGAVGWEVISVFDANQRGFIPDWSRNGARPLWSVCVGDLLELDCPEELARELSGWTGRVFFKVRKLSLGKMGVTFSYDARQLTPDAAAPNYMRQLEIDNKGLSYWGKHKARKVELSPFGKVVRKHKALWYGKGKKA